jgi:hypothetical protein
MNVLKCFWGMVAGHWMLWSSLAALAVSNGKWKPIFPRIPSPMGTPWSCGPPSLLLGHRPHKQIGNTIYDPAPTMVAGRSSGSVFICKFFLQWLATPSVFIQVQPLVHLGVLFHPIVANTWRAIQAKKWELRVSTQCYGCSCLDFFGLKMKTRTLGDCYHLDSLTKDLVIAII